MGSAVDENIPTTMMMSTMDNENPTLTYVNNVVCIVAITTTRHKKYENKSGVEDVFGET